MPLVSIRLGSVAVTAVAQTKGYTVPKSLGSPPGGLWPMKSAAFEMDEYRLLAGWPVAVPPCGIRCHTMVSGDGIALGDRDSATTITTGADVRWLADPDYFNQTTCEWLPIQGTHPMWSAGPTLIPSLINDYEYTVDDERFTSMSALNFDSDTGDYLTADLNQALSTVHGYTLIMVMSPNSSYGNNIDLPFNAIWCNPPDPQRISLSLTIARDVNHTHPYLMVELTDKPIQRGIAMSEATATEAPSYLAVVVNRPKLTMYLGQGPKNISSVKLDIGPPSLPLNGTTLLGKHPADGLHNADMALFDLSLYSNPLTTDQVADEFSLLSKIYGGN